MKRFAAVTAMVLIAFVVTAGTLAAQSVTFDPAVPVNGWNLVEVRGTAPAEATTALVPGGGPHGSSSQLFRYAVSGGQPPILIYEKLLGERIAKPSALGFWTKEDLFGATGNFPIFMFYLGNADTVYPIGTNGVTWGHLASGDMDWLDWQIVTQQVLADSIDRIQLWLSFFSPGPDTVEVSFAALEALTGKSTPTLLDGFGSLPRPQLVSPGETVGVQTELPLRWNTIEGTLAYQVQVTATTYFRDLIVDDSTVTDTVLLVPNLVANKEYRWRVRAKNAFGWSMWSSEPYFTMTTAEDVKEIPSGIPTEYRLDQNYPNPFNPVTLIRFTLPESGPVTLRVLSALGQEVATLVSGRMDPGTYEADWNASGYASGVYFYELRTDEVRLVKRMVLVR